MQAIMIQLERELVHYGATRNSIETLFIGGGTPSCVKSKYYEPVFKLLSFYLKKDAEITTEANPNSATTEWLQGMFDLGVNRLSFGVQSFNSQKLTFLNRNHTPKDAVRAISQAQTIGFENISLDLIYGTALDNRELLLSDLQKATTLPINHLSAYSLTIEEKTKFYETPDVAYDNESLAFWFVNEIEKRGFPSYEISNFGLYESRHNKGYWEYKDYIGVGAGAVGFLKDRRFYTQNDIHAYIQNPLKISTELLNQEAIKSEKILLGLRSNVGFSQSLLTQEQRERARYLIEENKISYHGKRYYNNNFFLSDELALYLTS